MLLITIIVYYQKQYFVRCPQERFWQKQPTFTRLFLGFFKVILGRTVTFGRFFTVTFPYNFALSFCQNRSNRQANPQDLNGASGNKNR